jgi:hypothetical protein
MLAVVSHSRSLSDLPGYGMAPLSMLFRSFLAVLHAAFDVSICAQVPGNAAFILAVPYAVIGVVKTRNKANPLLTFLSTKSAWMYVLILLNTK